MTCLLPQTKLTPLQRTLHSRHRRQHAADRANRSRHRRYPKRRDRFSDHSCSRVRHSQHQRHLYVYAGDRFHRHRHLYFKINDTHADSTNAATVTITVNPPANHAPVATNDTFPFEEDSGQNTVGTKRAFCPPTPTPIRAIRLFESCLGLKRVARHAHVARRRFIHLSTRGEFHRRRFIYIQGRRRTHQ